MLSFLLMIADIIYRDDDSRLVHGALSGNQSDFEELVRKYEKLIYNAAYQLTSSSDDAFDVSQDTFIKAYRSLGSFRGDCKFSTWLYKICQNAARDHLRSKTRNQTVSLTVPDEDDQSAQLDVEDDDPASDPEQQLERLERRQAVRDAIAQLSDDHREIIILRDIDGLSYEDISEMLDLEIGTVKSRINRARLAVKDFLIKRNIL